jgi:hypothetical protein
MTSEISKHDRYEKNNNLTIIMKKNPQNKTNARRSFQIKMDNIQKRCLDNDAIRIGQFLSISLELSFLERHTFTRSLIPIAVLTIVHIISNSHSFVLPFPASLASRHPNSIFLTLFAFLHFELIIIKSTSSPQSFSSTPQQADEIQDMHLADARFFF